MNQKKYVQLVDELMTVVQVMDELYRYHPNNPNKVNVENEYKQMASRKKKSKPNWMNSMEQEMISDYKSLKVTTNILKNKPGSLEDAF